ncbi:MAG TPA: GNAT family N-acetyltransferase [Ignavibacteriaceae bacterium]|nr:GNAT family N-acetyltransferase [Ignavibacteriaceae bacterium]
MDDVIISDDKTKLDIELIHNFLTTSYWAEGRTIEAVKKSIEHSICFGVYKGGKQIGFARIVTDYTVIAYLMDVFILEEYRGKGFSKLLLKIIFEDDKFKSIKKWLLATKDAHSLYTQFGFGELKNPDRLMEKVVQRK